MKKLLRDGTVCWATGEHADALIAGGWTEVKAPPTVPTPMTPAQRRARWQAREAVQAAEAQIWLAREAQRVREECETADRQWFYDLEQRLASWDIAIAAREAAEADRAAVQEACDHLALQCLRDQLIEVMALQEKHPHPANEREVARLRAEIKALYLQSTRA